MRDKPIVAEPRGWIARGMQQCRSLKRRCPSGRTRSAVRRRSRDAALARRTSSERGYCRASGDRASLEENRSLPQPRNSSALDSAARQPQPCRFRTRTSDDDRAGSAYTRRHECRSEQRKRPPCRISPISGSAASSTVRTLWPDRPTALLGAVAGVVDVLAGGPIRRDLQAHRATARVAEQPPASTPVSLPERTKTRRLRRPRHAAASSTPFRPVDRPRFGRHVLSCVVDVCISEPAPRLPSRRGRGGAVRLLTTVRRGLSRSVGARRAVPREIEPLAAVDEASVEARLVALGARRGWRSYSAGER